MDKDEAAAVWAEAHTDAGRPDPAVELAQLEAVVYSRAGSAESLVDFIDPVTGETVRATPSQLRLRALRASRAEQTAGLDALDRQARVPAPDAAETDSSDTPDTPDTPAAPPGLTGPRRRRLVLPLVAAAAFAAGIVTVLIAMSVPGRIDAPGTPVASAEPLLIFDFPSRFPDIAVPDLGDEFVADSLRNVSGTSLANQGFGVYLGRETDSGLRDAPDGRHNPRGVLPPAGGPRLLISSPCFPSPRDVTVSPLGWRKIDEGADDEGSG